MGILFEEKTRTIDDLATGNLRQEVDVVDIEKTIGDLQRELAAVEAEFGNLNTADQTLRNARAVRDRAARMEAVKARRLDLRDRLEDARAEHGRVLLTAFERVRPVIQGAHRDALRPIYDTLIQLERQVAQLEHVERVAGNFTVPRGSISTRRTIAMEVGPALGQFLKQWLPALTSMLGGER